MSVRLVLVVAALLAVLGMVVDARLTGAAVLLVIVALLMG